MIIVNDKTLERISTWKDKDVYILTDFDRTLTEGRSESSWGILSKSDLITKEYALDRQKLYNYYRPIEINEEMDYDTKNKLMIEWWNKHIGLFIKYNLKEDVIKKAALDTNVMSFRKGTKEFLKDMNDRNIPVIIISAGIGNFIKQFLINNNCDYENIYIVSNFIKFENGYAIGIEGTIIHSLNKNEVSIPLEIKEIINKRKNIILMGDSISDVLMAKEEDRADALKIGFLEEKIEENLSFYKNAFDIVCTNNTGFDELNKYIKND